MNLKLQRFFPSTLRLMTGMIHYGNSEAVFKRIVVLKHFSKFIGSISARVLFKIKFQVYSLQFNEKDSSTVILQ